MILQESSYKILTPSRGFILHLSDHSSFSKDLKAHSCRNLKNTFPLDRKPKKKLQIPEAVYKKISEPSLKFIF